LTLISPPQQALIEKAKRLKARLNGEADAVFTDEERAAKIEEVRKAGPVAFILTYGFVLEPRPPVSEEQLDLDFEAYLTNLKDGKELNDLALDIMPGEVEGTGDLPFELWDFQIALIIWFDWLVKKGESGLVEKSRDMGYTWCYVWWALYHFVCTKSFSALFGSKKEAAVDNGTISSIFGKLDYAIEKLPDWLKPKGYDRRKHRTRLKIVNPENPNNYFVGDSQTADFGASERHTVVIPDESALWDRDPSGTISNTTNTAIYGSSVRGENHHYRMKLRLEARSPSLVRRLEWNLNPTHTQAWFQAMQSRMDEADFAREVLIDYQASVKGKYYPICNVVKQLDRIEWERGWPSDLAMDYGVGDNMAMLWWQRKHDESLHRMMYAYTNSGKPIEFYIPFMLAKPPNESIYLTDGYNRPVLDQNKKMVFKKLTEIYDYTESDLRFISMLMAAGVAGNLEYRGDPAGRQRSQDTAVSIEQKLASVGINVFSNTKQNDYLSRRSALTDVLLKTEVNLEGAYEAFNAIQQSKYPDRRENSQSTTSPNAPVHDWTSHYRSAAEYHAVGESKLFVPSVGGQRAGIATLPVPQVRGGTFQQPPPVMPGRPQPGGGWIPGRRV
jgi:hypothetical protein